MKKWEKEGQPEFDFSECYIANYPPLDLSLYQNDRNYNFYKLQNDLLPFLNLMFNILQEKYFNSVSKRSRLFYNL